MIRPMRTRLLVLSCLFLYPGHLIAREGSAEESADAIMLRNYIAQHYPGDTARGHMRMELFDAQTNTRRVREMVVISWNPNKGGIRKGWSYLVAPEELRGIAALMVGHPDREDEHTGYMPAIDKVRRFSMREDRPTIAGSVYHYEDMSGRDLHLDTYKLLREENIGERACYVIEARAKVPEQYLRRILWIDK